MRAPRSYPEFYRAIFNPIAVALPWPHDSNGLILEFQPRMAGQMDQSLQQAAVALGLTIHKTIGEAEDPKGGTFPYVLNRTWKADRFMQPGFLVKLVYNSPNPFNPVLSAHPTFPAALAIGLALGFLLQTVVGWPNAIPYWAFTLSSPAAIVIIALTAVIFGVFAVAWLLDEKRNPLAPLHAAAFGGIAFGIASALVIGFPLFAGFVVGTLLARRRMEKVHGPRIRSALLAAADDAVGTSLLAAKEWSAKLSGRTGPTSPPLGYPAIPQAADGLACASCGAGVRKGGLRCPGCGTALARG